MASSTLPRAPSSPTLTKLKLHAVLWLLFFSGALLNIATKLSKLAERQARSLRRRLASRPRRKRLARVYVMPQAEARRVQIAIAADIQHSPDRLVSLLEKARKDGRL